MAGKILNGRYCLVEVVGEGGMGQLWKARDEVLGRYVAVKLISSLFEAPEAVARLRREARSAARLMSPHLAVVLDYGRDEESGREYVVSEFVVGSNLHRVLRNEGPQETMMVAQWAVQICTALSVVHDSGVYHRDLKPHNIMLSSEGLIKLVDFGIAAYADTSDYTRITVSGALIGSPAYMAPERVMNQTVDHRADLYSLGCTLYELITGQVPFAGPLPSVLIAHVNTAAQAPSAIRSDISPEWDRLILSLLAKDPRQRPQSSAELRQQLRRLTIADRIGQISQQPSSLAPARPAEFKTGKAETGRVKWWNASKGYGFVTADGSGVDVFVHFSMLAPGCAGLNEGERVSFRIVQMAKGPGAEDVRLI